MKNLNRFKKIGKSVSDVCLTLFIFLVVPAVLFTLITSRVNSILGIRSFVVLTGSMEPKIPTGSLIFTMDKSVYKVGEIITFKRGKVDITHRIVDIQNGKFQTKGDANQSADSELVNQSDVVGTNIIEMPLVGKFFIFLKTIPGFTIFIVIPNLIFIGFELWNVKEEYKKEIEKKIMRKLNQI